MKIKVNSNKAIEMQDMQEEVFGQGYPTALPLQTPYISKKEPVKPLLEVLFISSYPPRECGIATYSQDLIKSLNNKFSNTFTISVCALESGKVNYSYPEEVKYVLDTSKEDAFKKISDSINKDDKIQMVLIQHEFGFFNSRKQAFLDFLRSIHKPVAIVFHTVLPNPDDRLRSEVREIADACVSIVVMTNHSAKILMLDYRISEQNISVIAHGTHLVTHQSEEFLKMKYGLKDKKVLTTFGLLSSGKSIETTLHALPEILLTSPEVVFLVIGKTHPEVVKSEGEKYREMLENTVKELNLQEQVKFINQYLALPELLEYLQLSDIYLFTTNDPNQAVSGTFAYAMSCGCPILSTPIPHAKEVLTKDTGIIFDFRDSGQLAKGVVHLLNNEPLRRSIIINTLQKIVSTAWENSAVMHAKLFEKITGTGEAVKYNLPQINLAHLNLMTTETGIIQFSKLNHPDLDSGYTLDDNARALVAISMYYKMTGYEQNIIDIRKYLAFIGSCQQKDGNFLNYMDADLQFTSQNEDVNLDDSNGRAIWALGYLISLKEVLPADIHSLAKAIFERSLPHISKVYSTRSMAFAIKGLYYYNRTNPSHTAVELIRTFADRLSKMYHHESNINWEWYESYLTYANSVLPEAMLLAWSVTGENLYKEIALSSMKFLLSQTFNENGIEVISNKNWLLKGEKPGHYGEQPIDVAYTVMTLGMFYEAFQLEEYKSKMEIAFNWFLGDNRLHQIVYNPCTGGCYDGLEETHVNLNQGAESTVSYLMARLSMESFRQEETPPMFPVRKHARINPTQKRLLYSTDEKQFSQPILRSQPQKLD